MLPWVRPICINILASGFGEPARRCLSVRDLDLFMDSLCAKWSQGVLAAAAVAAKISHSSSMGVEKHASHENHLRWLSLLLRRHVAVGKQQHVCITSGAAGSCLSRESIAHVHIITTPTNPLLYNGHTHPGSPRDFLQTNSAWPFQTRPPLAVVLTLTAVLDGCEKSSSSFWEKGEGADGPHC